MNDKKKCLNCDNQARYRGVCPRCYWGIYRAWIRTRLATWEDCEKAGTVLPSRMHKLPMALQALRTKLRHVWRNMTQRCLNEDDAGYKWYGARGIRVCEEWRNSLPAFTTWALANGYQEGLKIDRIDNNGNYCPENCRWVDHKTQCRNQSSNKLVTAFGQTKVMAEWAEDSRCVVAYRRLAQRIWDGWNPEEAMTYPLTKYRKRKR